MNDDGRLPREKPPNHVPPGQMICWFLLILAFFIGMFILGLYVMAQRLAEINRPVR